MTKCEHLAAATLDGPVPGGGCPACLEAGDRWVHLRFCVDCGAVGCCNDSENQHAMKHALASGHPVIRTAEPDENWAWCYTDEVGLRLPLP